MWKFIKKLFEHKNKDGGTVRKIDFAQCYLPPIRKEVILLRDLAETLNIGLQLKDKTLAINQYELIVKHCENQIENLKKITMKISDLKQPYKRMAEYLGDENNTISHSLSNYFFIFYNKMHKGENPEITEEIKKHFPSDFDFSGEEVKNKPVMQMLDTETQKRIYTQLAKEGKFDELPDTCEFSEAVNMEVWDIQKHGNYRYVLGKFNGKFVAINRGFTDDYSVWNYAQLPTPKIDFSEFKAGYVVEVETNIEIKSITKIK